jgi:sulfite reductase beta subunit-like hemoprotein
MDIGLVGRMLRRNGQEHVQGFRVFAGGGKGQAPTLAQEIHAGLPAETVPEAVAWIADEYRRAQDGHSVSFAKFVAASGQTLREELARRYDLWNSGF